MRPDIHSPKSALLATVLRVGGDSEEAIEISVKISKATAIARPKSWKKFAARSKGIGMEVDGAEEKVEYAQLKMRTEYYVDRTGDHRESEDEDVKVEDDEENLLDDTNSEKPGKSKSEHLEKVEKEELVRGFKYGTTYAPCPDGQFPKLPMCKGMEICGFFPIKNVSLFVNEKCFVTPATLQFRREYVMGEISYIWADPSSPHQQAALSSIVQAMYQKGSMAIARMVTRDGMDPKMGILYPTVFDKVDCFLWAQVRIDYYSPRHNTSPSPRCLLQMMFANTHSRPWNVWSRRKEKPSLPILTFLPKSNSRPWTPCLMQWT